MSAIYWYIDVYVYRKYLPIHRIKEPSNVFNVTKSYNIFRSWFLFIILADGWN